MANEIKGTYPALHGLTLKVKITNLITGAELTTAGGEDIAESFAGYGFFQGDLVLDPFTPGIYSVQIFADSSVVSQQSIYFSSGDSFILDEAYGQRLMLLDLLNQGIDEQYPAVGAELSIAGALYSIHQSMHQATLGLHFSVPKKRVFKRDGSTVAKEFTVDDEAAPTTIDETL